MIYFFILQAHQMHRGIKMTAEATGEAEGKRFPGLPCSVPTDTTPNSSGGGELQEGSGTNTPRGKEETEQKGETGHKAASLAPWEQDLGGLLQKAPGPPLMPSPTAFGKERHPAQRQLSTVL